MREGKASPFARLGGALAEGHVVAFLGILWCLWLGAIAMGEKVPVNGGLGWDGSRFAKMTQAGPSMLIAKEINRYYVQRVGPSFAVRGLLGVIGAPLDDATVRAGFIALNTILLSLALVLLMDAGSRLGLGAAGRWILFIGLFANMANGRLPIYYAPIGDATAFFLGSLMVWAHVARRFNALVAAFMMAVVSWPAAFLLLPLLVWPRPPAGLAASLTPREERRSAGARLYVAAIPLGALVFSLLWLAVDMPGFAALTGEMALSLSVNAIYLGLAATLAGAVAWSDRPRVMAPPALRGVVAAIVLLGLSLGYVRAFESGSLAFGGQTYFREIILFARTRVLSAPAGYAAYYGALAIAALALWPQILRAALRLGTGAFLAVAISGLLSLDAESRRLNSNWALVGLLAALVVERVCADRAAVWSFAAAALSVSKLWWPLAGPDLFAAAHDPGNYFNTQGPSMSLEAFFAHLIAIALMGGWMLRISRRHRSSL